MPGESPVLPSIARNPHLSLWHFFTVSPFLPRVSLPIRMNKKNKTTRLPEDIRPVVEEEEEEDLEEALLTGGDQAREALLKLPLELFLDIISRLPIKPLAVSRCVCKTWRKIVHHPRFTKMHHTKQTQQPQITTSLLFHVKGGGDDEFISNINSLDVFNNGVTVIPPFYGGFPLELFGSCNGLVCLSCWDFLDPIYVCNPVIGEYFELPRSRKQYYITGFGFDEIGNKYKVIRMHYVVVDGVLTCNSEAEVFTLGSDEWREIGKVPYPLQGCNPHVFVNGALHWQSDSLIEGGILEYPTLSVPEVIVAFDVSKEEFRVIPHPPQLKGGFLVDLGGYLCLLFQPSHDRFEIWVMKEYGVNGSWTRECVISRKVPGYVIGHRIVQACCTPVMVMRNGNICLLNQKNIYRYDPAKKMLTKLPVRNMPPRFNAILHVGTFISLKDIVEPTNSYPDQPIETMNQPNLELWQIQKVSILSG